MVVGALRLAAARFFVDSGSFSSSYLHLNLFFARRVVALPSFLRVMAAKHDATVPLSPQ